MTIRPGWNKIRLLYAEEASEPVIDVPSRRRLLRDPKTLRTLGIWNKNCLCFGTTKKLKNIFQNFEKICFRKFEIMSGTKTPKQNPKAENCRRASSYGQHWRHSGSGTNAQDYGRNCFWECTAFLVCSVRELCWTKLSQTELYGAAVTNWEMIQYPSETVEQALMDVANVFRFSNFRETKLVKKQFFTFFPENSIGSSNSRLHTESPKWWPIQRESGTSRSLFIWYHWARKYTILGG